MQFSREPNGLKLTDQLYRASAFMEKFSVDFLLSNVCSLPMNEPQWKCRSCRMYESGRFPPLMKGMFLIETIGLRATAFKIHYLLFLTSLQYAPQVLEIMLTRMAVVFYLHSQISVIIPKFQFRDILFCDARCDNIDGRLFVASAFWEIMKPAIRICLHNLRFI